jgi:hypothetical protein
MAQVPALASLMFTSVWAQVSLRTLHPKASQGSPGYFRPPRYGDLVQRGTNMGPTFSREHSVRPRLLLSVTHRAGPQEVKWGQENTPRCWLQLRHSPRSPSHSKMTCSGQHNHKPRRSHPRLKGGKPVGKETMLSSKDNKVYVFPDVDPPT